MNFSCSALFFPGYSVFDMKNLPKEIGIEIYEDLFADINLFLQENKDRKVSLHKVIKEEPKVDKYPVVYRVSHTPIFGFDTCVENLPNETIEQFINKVGDNNMCIDIGHVMVADWGVENYINFIYENRNKIKCYHVSVNDGKEDYHNPITLYDVNNKYLKAHFLTSQVYTPKAVQCLEYWYDSFALHYSQSQIQNMFENQRIEEYRYKNLDRIKFITDNIKLIRKLFIKQK